MKCNVRGCCGLTYGDREYCFYHHKVFVTKLIDRDYIGKPKKLVDQHEDGRILYQSEE
jgi:hypothetical protein